MPKPDEIRYSRGKDRYDNKPEQRTAATWDEFFDTVKTDRATEKGKQYICGAMKFRDHATRPEKYPDDAHYRQAAGAEPSNFIAFDYDGFRSRKDARDVLSYHVERHLCLIYNTSSSTREAPRSRAILGASRYMTRAEREVVSRVIERDIQAEFGADVAKFDDAVYRSEQPIYLPLKGAKTVQGDGDLVDVDATLARALPEDWEKEKKASQEPKSSAEPVSDQKVQEIAEKVQEKCATAWDGTFKEPRGDLDAGIAEYRNNDGEPDDSRANRAIVVTTIHQARAAGVPEIQLPEVVERVCEQSPQLQGHRWATSASHRDGEIRRAIEANPPSAQSGGAGGDDARFANGQLRLSRIFAKRYQEVLKHDHARKKWVRFDDPRWQVCEKAEHEEQIKQGAEELLDKAAELIKSDPNSPANKLRMKFAMDCQQQRNIRAIAELMKSDPLLACISTDFDQDPDILGCANGYINLLTGELAEPDPAAMVSQIAPVIYDPDAKAPRWSRFLDEVLDGDKDVVGLMQRLIGYAATGHTSDEVLAIWYGLGANGKSVLGDTLARVLGDYAFMAPPSMILKQDDGRIRNDLAALAGKRLVSLNELPAGGELDAQTVKLLAGREPITARFLYGEYFTYQPTATPIVRTNHRPIVREMTAGMWRRLVLIPFRRQFDITKGKDLEQKLWAERSGILTWIVEGAIQWHREGLNIPPVIQAEVQAYRDESDIFGQFLSEYIIPSAGGKVQSFDLWGRWREFCAAEGIKDGSRQSFGRRVSEYGYSAKSSNGTRYFSGMELRNKVPSLSVVR